MKSFLTLVTTAVALVALSTSSFAYDCGPCTGGEKSKDKKTEKTESTQS